MRRTVNQTGRKKILLDLLQFTPKTEGSIRSIELSWNLSSLGLIETDELFVEVDSFATARRQSLGQVGDGVGSFKVELDYIQDLRVAKLKMFSVKTENDIRLITATSTEVPIIFDVVSSDSTELLKVQKVDSLETLWEVDYSSGEPILQICNRNGIYPNITSGPIFFASILPAAVKDIAYKALSEGSPIQDEALDVWRQYFLHLGLNQVDLDYLTQSSNMDEQELSELRLDKAQFLSERFSVTNKLVERVVNEVNANAN
jgi:hypothetical protein